MGSGTTDSTRSTNGIGMKQPGLLDRILPYYGLEHSLPRVGLGAGMIALLVVFGAISLVNPVGTHLGAARPQPASAAGRLGSAGTPVSAPQQRVRALDAYAKLPVAFEPNRGQSDPQVRFLARGRGYTLLLTETEAVLDFRKPVQKPKSKSEEGSLCVTRPLQEPAANDKGPKATDAALSMHLSGSNPWAKVTGFEELPGKSNYFIGNDSKKWLRSVPTYAKVRDKDVYPGIDLVYYGNPGQLEYDFVVASGADPGAIALQLQTQDRKLASVRSKSENRQSKSSAPLRIDGEGNLAVKIEGGEVVFQKPIAYQPTSCGTDSGVQHRRPVESGWVLRAGNRVSFALGGYDKTKCLVIDPALSYSTYLGGTSDDIANGIALDGSGNVYVTGSTSSANFPVVSSYQKTIGEQSNAFITKLDPTGTTLVYSTYLGGAGIGQGRGIAVDSSGAAYVAGYTTSSNFPTTSGSFQTTYGGEGDAFVAKLDPAGSKLVYSSYLGGSGSDFGNGIALDGAGSAYVTGSTQSTNFPTATPLQSANGGEADAFVSKLSADGTKLVYSTYLGGSNADSGQGIAVDATGGVYVAGYTLSTNLTTVSAVQTASGGDADAFVAKLNAAGSAVAYLTYLGGNGADHAKAIAIDSGGNAYVTGDTASPNFPTTAGTVQPTLRGSVNAFVAKLSASGSSLSYSTYLGGSETDQGFGIARDSSGNAYVTGFTQSADFPLMNAFQTALGGGMCGSAPCSDAFVTELDADGTALVYSTYLGGDAADSGQAIALDSSRNAYVAGGTASANFPVTGGVVRPAFGGGTSTGDAFVAKISPSNVPALAATPQTLTFTRQARDTTSPPQTVTLTNVGTAALDISGISVSSEFAATNHCPASLATGSACTVSVSFVPTVAGAAVGKLTINHSAARSPHELSLNGTGADPAPGDQFSPTTLTFGAQTIGTSSAPQPVTLTNIGDATLTISAVTVSTNFSQTNNCGTSLAAGASCVNWVTFTPTTTTSNPLTGSLTITSNATTPPTANLTGVSLAQFSMSVTPTSPIITIGTASTTFTVSASAPKSFTGSITLSCTNSGGATCTYSPTSINPGQTSSLTVSSLATITSSPINFDVTGTSGNQTASTQGTILLADFSLAAAPPLQAIENGAAANYAVVVSPTNGFNQTVSLSCLSTLTNDVTGLAVAPYGVSCSFAPASLALNGKTPLTSTMTVQTTKRTVAAPRARPRPPIRPHGLLYPGTLLLVGLLMAAFVARRCGRERAPRGWRLAPGLIVLGSLLLAVAVWPGCDQYYYNPITTAPPTGTPPGVFTVTIQGAVSGTTSVPSHTTTVNLSDN